MTHPSGLLALTDDRTRRLRMSQMPEFVEQELDTTGVDLVELHGMVMRDQPLPSKWDPTKIANLTTWLDAADYTLGTWANKASGGPAVNVVGTPAMTLQPGVLNGKSVVRFKTNEGRVRSGWPYPVYDYTVLYLTRWIGPSAGRMFSVQYPPSNLLIGTHSSGRDLAYDNGTWINAPATDWGSWPRPGPWRMYECDSKVALGLRFYIDGTLIGSSGGSGGFTNGWGLSGYDPAGAQETFDFEVAELLIWNRRLEDAERIRVEDYMRERWGL